MLMSSLWAKLRQLRHNLTLGTNGKPKHDDELSPFEQRIEKQSSLERELSRTVAAILKPGEDMFQSDFFLLGATRRTLAQSKGFRELISSRNFPCAASIVRLQIDTAMRINGLSLVESIDEFCASLMAGERFNKGKCRDGNKLSDAYLRKRLSEQHSWINPVYETTSDLIHLSHKHLWNSIVELDDGSKTVFMQISTDDPKQPDEVYFEVMDGFFEATKLASMLIIACLTAIHGSERDTNAGR